MISVITPCQNIISEGRYSFFKKMMSTLHEQTYQDFEHIVVDGYSKDGTVDLLHDYFKLGQINTLISEPDNNLYEAINKGLKRARGNYIHVMNSDDYFATDRFFEISLRALVKHHVDYTHADRIIIKRDGSPPSIKRGNERIAFFRMPFRYQTMLIKKDVYDELGPFDERYEIASDYKWMLKMILAGKRGYYMSRILIYSLDGGITLDRQKCIREVTQVLHECYGKRYGLDINECRDIYVREISPSLFSKITSNVTDKKIRNSLMHCYDQHQSN